MIDNYFGANLIDYNTVKVALFSPIQKPDSTPINLSINDEKVVRLEIKKQVFLNGISMYTCTYKDGFKLGNSYKLSIENYGVANLDVSEAINFPGFDDDYYYPNDDLGVTYSKEETTFKIWAPLASKVELLIRKDFDSPYVGHYLKREDKGVYSLTLKGNYDSFHYVYLVTNNEIPTLTTDPYAKASTANGKENVVVDFEKTKIDMHEEKLPNYKSYLYQQINRFHMTCCYGIYSVFRLYCRKNSSFFFLTFCKKSAKTYKDLLSVAAFLPRKWDCILRRRNWAMSFIIHCPMF